MIAVDAGYAVPVRSFCMDTSEFRKVMVLLEDREALADLNKLHTERSALCDAAASELRAAAEAKTAEAKLLRTSFEEADSARKACVDFATRDEKLPSRKTVAAIVAVVTAFFVLLAD